MPSDWAFTDPEETEVITLERILRGESAILLACHDLEDHGWQFLDGEHVFEEDGAAVYLADLVQLDPSLSEIADLPPGWYAWRTAPGQPWRRAEGEPEAEPAGRSEGTAPSGAKNIEIKARVPDMERLESDAAAFSDTPVEILDQEDIFYSVPDGRLKLRILADDHGELIHYFRGDDVGPRPSRYIIAPTEAPAALRAILDGVLPIIGTVRKQRRLYRVGPTRIHLDRVEGLGDFMELEVVLYPGQDESDGVAIAETLMERLGIARDQLVPDAYIDLLRDLP